MTTDRRLYRLLGLARLDKVIDRVLFLVLVDQVVAPLFMQIDHKLRLVLLCQVDSFLKILALHEITECLGVVLVVLVDFPDFLVTPKLLQTL